MASSSQSESRRLYSWWWDSHIPKNSKWIQDNLADMDYKVKTMIKLIEADADSFARRADMYFKKRPELIKLVEELYRAYRALAERYDHTTVELRHAHKVMAESFPNQIPFDMIDDDSHASSSSYESHHHHTQDLHKDSHKADTEVEGLKRTLLELQAEKEALNLQYQLTLNKVNDDTQRDAEEDQSKQEDNERKALKQELMKLNEVNEDLSVRYQKCLETISNLEKEVSHAQDNAKRLSSEVLAGAAKLKTVEEQCALWKSFHQDLKAEGENLTHKLLAKDQELVEKQNELERLQSLMQELGASLKNMETLHSQSQEEQKVLSLKLQSKIQMLRELEMQNHKLEGDSSTISLQIQRNEISCLKGMKEKLEEEVAKQRKQSSGLQIEIYCLKDNIDNLNKSYQTLLDQVRLTGLEPESLSYTVKKLQEENSKLLELYTNQRDEKDETESILNRNADLEKLLLESNTKLECSREKTEDLQERCESLRGEKSDLAAERASLLSQLQIMAVNMQKLLEKNSLLESSLSVANIELESLRDKSKWFEDFFTLLKNDKSELMKEKESLVSQLYNVEEKLGVLEKRYTEQEVKYAHHVEELQVSLATETEEHTNYKQSTESRLADLHKNVSYLREECRCRKREYEEELDRVVNKQVEIFILQKLIEELEEKNFSLLIECQKYVEASEVSEKLISELESENLEQQMEAEIFLDEIDSLRNGIYQVVKTLQVEADTKDQLSVSRVLAEINGLKCSFSRAEYDMQRLVVENSVLLSFLDQVQSDGLVLESEKKIIKRDLNTILQQCGVLEMDKKEVMEENRLLKSELIQREQKEQELRAELQKEHIKFDTLHDSYMVLQQDYSYTVKENKTLLLKLSELKDGMCVVEEENDAVLEEVVALGNMCVVYKSFGSEMAEEVETLEEKLKGKEEESQGLNKMLEKLHEGVEEEKFLNGLLERQVFNVDEVLEHIDMEILESDHMIKVTHNANAELHKEVEELRKEFVEMSDVAGRQEEEIRKLSTLNKNLESEVELLHEEIQQQQVREEFLNLELQDQNNEVGLLWDSEAVAKTMKIKQMKETVSYLECQVTELKKQLSAYDPLIEAVCQEPEESGSTTPCKEIMILQKSSEKVVDKLELSRNIEDTATILEKLFSDSRRLSSIQISLTDLRSKIAMNEKQGRFSNSDLVIVKRQLKEMEEALLQLTNTNEILSKEIEETGDARDIYRKVVIEKSRNGSEKIDQLQNKMQNIEQTVVNLEDVARSKMLSKKRNRFCGCIRSSAKDGS